MKFIIEPGTSADIDELEKLYNELNDYLAATINYPGWIKGIYPIREDAVAGVNDNALRSKNRWENCRFGHLKSSAGKGL